MDQVYFQVVPNGEEMIQPDECWQQAVLDPVTCNTCGDILSASRSSPIDVNLDWDGYPPFMVPLVHHTIPIIIARLDLCNALSTHLAGWGIGRVFLRGASVPPEHSMPLNGPTPNYRSVIVPTSHRCRLCTKDMSVFRQCPECGRQLGSPPDDDIWLDIRMVAGRSVVAPPHGGRLLLSPSTIQELPAPIRTGLTFEAVAVRRCPEA